MNHTSDRQAHKYQDGESVECAALRRENCRLRTELRRLDITSNRRYNQLAAQTLDKEKQIDFILSSRSFRLTAPLRMAAKIPFRISVVFRLLFPAIKKGGGIMKTTCRTVAVLKKEGVSGIRSRLLDLYISINDEKIRK